MIRNFWYLYQQYVLKYSCTRGGEIRHIFANLLTILPIVSVGFLILLVYYGFRIFAIERTYYIAIILISIGFGRLFLAFIMEKNNCDFGKAYTPAIRYTAYSSLMIVSFTIMFALLQNIYNNQSVINSISDNNLKTAISTSIDKNTTYQNQLPKFKSTIINVYE